MTVSEAIAKLTPRTSPMPKDALNCLRNNWPEAEPLLLKAMDEIIADPWEDTPAIFYYALYLCAEMHSEAVFERYIKIGRLPNALVYHLVGPIITGAFTAMLFETCCSQSDQLKALIEDETVFFEIRSAALAAYIHLARENRIPIDDLKTYCKELLEYRLERFPGYIWDHAVSASAHLGIKEALPFIESAYDCSLVDPGFITLEKAKNLVAKSIESDVDFSNYTFYKLKPVEQEMAPFLQEWTDSEDGPGRDDSELIDTLCKVKQIADRLDEIKFNNRPERNDPCPCGSGKKFKKCCMNNPDFSGEFELSSAPKPMSRADELIDTGYFEVEEGGGLSALLCWWHAWREIIDSHMIPGTVLDPDDEQCNCFNSCPSFSDWIHGYLLEIVKSAPNSAKTLRQAQIFCRELLDRFPCTAPKMRHFTEYVLARVLMLSGRQTEGMKIMTDIVDKEADDPSFRMLLAHMTGLRAPEFNMRPDWDYALKRAREARQLGKKDVTVMDKAIEKMATFKQYREANNKRLATP